MLLIDDRAGSCKLADYYPLEGCHVVSRLEWGDAMLTGHGPDGSSITVGVEVKSIQDLMSSISTGRLGGTQIPNMLKSYDYVFLVIFGQYRPGPAGVLQVRSKRNVWRTYRVGKTNVPWAYLQGWLTTLTMLTPFKIVHLYDDLEVACWLRCVDHWLEKPWDQHKALNVFDKSRENAAPPEADPVEAQIAKTAASFPAIDFVKGWSFARHFDSVADFMAATPDELMKVKGIGPVIAKSTYSTIRRRK